MKYNYEVIGKRIAELREAQKRDDGKSWSQQDLIDALAKIYPVGRNTISAIERGKAEHFDLKLLTSLCEVFNCDIGHILEGYECKTRDVQFIHDEIGLSEKTIKQLGFLAFCAPEYIAVIDGLLIDPMFTTFVQEFSLAISLKKECNVRDLVMDDVRDQLGTENYKTFKDLLHSVLPDMNDSILEKTVGVSVNIHPDDLSKFYYMAAKDSVSEAVSYLYKSMSQK